MARLDPASILGPGGAVARRLPRYELRDQQLQMAEAVAQAIERPGPPGRRGRHGRRQELRLPRPGDPGRRRAEEEGRRLDPHDRAAGAVAPQGHPVPAVGDAAGVLGRPGQGPGELHQPPPARRGRRRGRAARSSGRRSSTSSPRSGCGPAGPATARRSDLDFRPAGQRLGRGPERQRQLPGPRVPAEQGLLLLQGPPPRLDGQPADRQPRPVRQRPGAAASDRASASCPSTTWRSSTRPTPSRPWPASTWACSSRTSASTTRWPGCTTSGPARARSVYHRAARGHRAGRRVPRRRPKTSSSACRQLAPRPGRRLQRPGRASRSAGPSTLCEELRRLAAAIDRGVRRRRGAGGQRSS